MFNFNLNLPNYCSEEEEMDKNPKGKKSGQMLQKYFTPIPNMVHSRVLKCSLPTPNIRTHNVGNHLKLT